MAEVYLASSDLLTTHPLQAGMHAVFTFNCHQLKSMVHQVHDRDAKPQPQGFVPAPPKPLPAVPQKGKAGKLAVRAAAATPKTPVTAANKAAAPAVADAPAEPAAPVEPPSE